MARVSIVVPIYNKEATLKRCVKSILAQTFEDFELLLVDDGSTDNSLNLCHELEKKDSRISVFTKKNGGVSSARNKGIKESKGDYISFIDADDYIDEKFLELMLNRIESDGASVCYICNVYGDDSKSIDRHVFGDTVIDGNKNIYKEIVLPLINHDSDKNQLLQSAANKLYSNKVIKDFSVFFDENLSYAEDYLFNVLFFKNASSVSFVDSVLYFYDRTITGSLSKNHLFGGKQKYSQSVYVHVALATLFPEERGGESLAKVLLHNASLYTTGFARYHGFLGLYEFSSFCFDVLAKNRSRIVGKQRFTISGFLVRNGFRSLYVVYMYLCSLPKILKLYLLKLKQLF